MKLSTNTLSNLIIFLVYALFMAFLLGRNCSGNSKCDEACQRLGYPAGELVPNMKHKACVCWSKQPGPQIEFLLERD